MQYDQHESSKSLRNQTKTAVEFTGDKIRFVYY